jgi:hypothetical protein
VASSAGAGSTFSLILPRHLTVSEQASP